MVDTVFECHFQLKPIDLGPSLYTFGGVPLTSWEITCLMENTEVKYKYSTQVIKAGIMMTDYVLHNTK